MRSDEGSRAEIDSRSRVNAVNRTAKSTADVQRTRAKLRGEANRLVRTLTQAYASEENGPLVKTRFGVAISRNRNNPQSSGSPRSARLAEAIDDYEVEDTPEKPAIHIVMEDNPAWEMELHRKLKISFVKTLDPDAKTISAHKLREAFPGVEEEIEQLLGVKEKIRDEVLIDAEPTFMDIISLMFPTEVADDFYRLLNRYNFSLVIVDKIILRANRLATNSNWQDPVRNVYTSDSGITPPSIRNAEVHFLGENGFEQEPNFRS
jgi:hypothetical protein